MKVLLKKTTLNFLQQMGFVMNNNILKFSILVIFSFVSVSVFANEDSSQDELSFIEFEDASGLSQKNDCTQENIDDALKLISEFRAAEKQHHNFHKSKEATDNLLKNLNELFPNITTIPEGIEGELLAAFTEYATKYHDELLAENGIFLKGSYPGGYTIYFTTAEKYSEYEFPWFKQYRKIRFRIDETAKSVGGLSFDKLTNVHLILLNKEKYELIRHNIKTIQAHGWSTGEIVMSESDYQNLSDAALITDQDR